MEFSRKIESLRKLNTKGCCFLCLKSAKINQIKDFSDDDQNHLPSIKSASIRSLLRHLQIPAIQPLNGQSLVVQDLTKENIEVDLCEICEQMIYRFSVLFQNLEKINLEMDYFLERIHQCISQSAKAPELVQNYSKRMTSDLEALSQLAFVDNLRKQVAKESLRNFNAPRLQLVLTRASSKLIKTEINAETSESRNDPESSYPDEISPPPSPNSTADYQKDRKGFIKISPGSDSQENEDISNFLKPPVKQKTSKSQYYKKNYSTGLYQCNKCDKKSKDRKTISSHYKSVHLKLRHKCGICNVSDFSALRTLIKHKKSCRENLGKVLALEKEKKKFQFVCNECGKRFKTKGGLLQHLRFVHKNVRRYACDQCGKKFQKSDHLRNHRDAVHFIKKFNCRFCSKSFAYIRSIQEHEKNCAHPMKKESQEKP